MTTLNEIEHGGYVISSNKSRIDAAYVHAYLSQRSYWAKDIPLEIVKTSIANSSCAGVYEGGNQVGFGRLITDYATFGYLADVFIDEAHRGKGLGKKLVGFLLRPEATTRLRRLMLGTRDAHGLYETFGFHLLSNPQAFMEIHRPDVYQTKTNENG